MTREQEIYKEAEGRCIDLLAAKKRGDANTICPQSYRAGFMDGAIWADNFPNWISVDRGLPPKFDVEDCSDVVLVYTEDGTKDTACYDYEDKRWLWFPNVTHWMPLPPTPRKEE